jgi:hypothetical protein
MDFEHSNRELTMRGRIHVIGLMTFGLTISGCTDLTGNQSLPAGTADPASYATAAGARGMRNAAIAQFEAALPSFIRATGLLTDEFVDLRTDVSTGVLLTGTAVEDPLDERILTAPTASQQGGGPGSDGGAKDAYNNLQSVREFANQAIGALAAYDTASSDTVSVRVMRGELYAIEGYAEIMLADLFCSGVPLSTLDFNQDYTLRPGSRTAEIYHDAIAKFDTALMLAVGVDSVTHLAQVGRGRAWLDLGQYDSAAIAVQNVPVSFHYQTVSHWSGLLDIGDGQVSGTSIWETPGATVADREGLNGLPFRSSADPRSAVTSWDYSYVNTHFVRYFPQKYQSGFTGNLASPIVVADGVEAQLIRAEAALQQGNAGSWLTILNTLRTSGTIDSVTWIDTVGITPPVYGDSGRLVSQREDTVYNGTHTQITQIYVIETYLRPFWGPGSGGVGGLYPIRDPGDPVAQIDTLFTERAMWLFATGHRQGDLRRLLRQYGNYSAFLDQSQVYPIGPYTAPGKGVYGSDVTVPLPAAEYANPLFHGCLNRDA